MKHGRYAQGCGKPRTHWTRSEDQRIALMVGDYNLDKIVAALPGRTERAVRHRMAELGLSPREGSYSLHSLCKSTGYDWRQIRRAKAALGQHWQRNGKHKKRADGKGGTWIVITDEQAEAIIDYLANEPSAPKRWAKGLDRCLKCRSAKRPHAGLGLCSACYQRRQYGERCQNCGARPWTMARLLNITTLRHKNARRKLRVAA